MDPSPGLTLATLFADFGMILFALILVLLNGFFVAAEFAMVKLRSTRVEAIAEDNGWRGQILRTVHNQLDAYLSACQLGITLASLGLSTGEIVVVEQPGGSARLPAQADAGVAPGAVWLAAAHPETAGLAAIAGPVSVRKA